MDQDDRAGVRGGRLWTEVSGAGRQLGDGCVRLSKARIGPLVFCVVVAGITKAGDLKSFGRMGLKALIWFEVATTV
ncbi:C4-dicarboxylate transporter DctA, partial [Streptomyces albidoflavus]|uniref:cation:dicarboxylate symporter family transporter n=1 Tax=Streptomyces albidoflavus TaxID=1886 RepID=UPI000BCF31B6